MSLVNEIFGKSFEELYPHTSLSGKLKSFADEKFTSISDGLFPCKYPYYIIFEDEQDVIYAYLDITALMTFLPVSGIFSYGGKLAKCMELGRHKFYLFRD